ncbi:hypothetical protein M569_13075 [Genlisea aurea]|uniref:Uncharacterized protein n=1 Tax=Genlisea aurea TaxID=192259 RepID=S8C4U0_9LAMI|nr:hypothetical protein M569_13075 [Genlisea aurea]
MSVELAMEGGADRILHQKMPQGTFAVAPGKKASANRVAAQINLRTPFCNVFRPFRIFAKTCEKSNAIAMGAMLKESHTLEIEEVSAW